MLVHTTVTAALILTSALATGVQSSEREMPTHMGTLLSFNRGEQTFVEYRFSDKDFKPYVQVLRSPGGINVVRDRPYDHLHHRGLMFAVNMNGIEFWGQSFVADINGMILKQASKEDEEILICPVDLSLIEETKKRFSFPYRDRRIDSYQDLLKLYSD